MRKLPRYIQPAARSRGHLMTSSTVVIGMTLVFCTGFVWGFLLRGWI